MKSFLKKKKLSEDMTLQITSMADIFMILLVFLLKSYSTTLTTVSPSRDTKLPVAASSGEMMKDTLKLEVASDGILVDQKPVVRLKNFEFAPSEIQPSGNSEALFKVLYAERKRLPEPNQDSNLLILADENTPYSTIRPILASAASAGFVDLQLVVVQKD